MGAPCNGDAPGRCLLSVATYFSSTHFGGNDVCKTKSRIDLFCKQRDHWLSVHLLQRSIRPSAAAGREWPQQAAVRTVFEIYYLGHVQRRVRPSCGFPVGPVTPVWSDSLVGHHCMMYLGHREAPVAGQPGHSGSWDRWVWVWGVEMTTGCPPWRARLEDGGWDTKTVVAHLQEGAAWPSFVSSIIKYSWGLWAQLNCYFIIVQCSVIIRWQLYFIFIFYIFHLL